MVHRDFRIHDDQSAGQRAVCQERFGKGEDFIRTKVDSIGRLVGISAVIAFVVALSASLALDFSDSVFQSRLLPWTVPLIKLQSVGFVQVARMFPCRSEGFNTGCEWSKTLPTFVAANAAYLPFALVGVYLYRRSEGVKTAIQRGQHSFVRCATQLS